MCLGSLPAINLRGRSVWQMTDMRVGAGDICSQSLLARREIAAHGSALRLRLDRADLALTYA
jgi:hypothetical protein